ncbi:MAG TPA: hypothetical protein VMA13_02750 [Candidatus Saccharimonadales bacterium]|nr:hypothetical protein [Candidatus Saccharimonadales bacterium]
MSDVTPKESAAAKGKPVVKVQVPIHFIKGTCFRVVHANGVWYGGDNQGNLHMTFFNERNPIPQKLVVNVDEHGSIVGEDVSQRESKEGVVREMEVDVVMSLRVAQELYVTLGENLKAIQTASKLSLDEQIKAYQEIVKHESTVSK